MKSHCCRLVWVLIPLVLIIHSSAIGQTDSTYEHKGFWFQIGMGMAGGTVGDIAYDIGGTLSYKGVWTIRAMGASTRDDYSPDRLESFAVMYGIRSHTKHVMAMLSAGPNRTEFSTRQISGVTFGLTIEGEMMIRPVILFGLGVRIAENFNAKRSYLTAGLFIEFGLLWV